MSLNLSIKNLDKLVAEIKAYPQDIDRIIINEFKNFGQAVAADAQRLAPVDESALRGSIKAQITDVNVSITANVDYAGYVEFGTKSFAAAYVATLPAEWHELAAEVKSNGVKGGSFKDLVAKIAAWVHRKGLGTGHAGIKPIGIAGVYSVKTRKRVGTAQSQEKEDLQTAYAIAKKIVTIGIPAQPFLFPAYMQNIDGLLTALKNQLNAK